jgi:hypothetical protein
VTNYVFTKMQLIAKSVSREHTTALRELLRRKDTFDQFYDMLRNLDAVVDYAAESGEEMEDRDEAFLGAAAEFFHE